MHRAAVIAELREQLRARAPFLDATATGETGLDALDARLGGLPEAAVCVVTGARGAGRARLAARVLAARAQTAPVAWVDGTGAVHPPALLAEGIELSRLLVVRRAHADAVYAFEQILESGLFARTAATGLDGWLTPARARRIQRAAEAGRGTAMLVLDPDAARAFTGAAVRLRVHGQTKDGALRVEIERDRRGGTQGLLTLEPGRPVAV